MKSSHNTFNDHTNAVVRYELCYRIVCSLNVLFSIIQKTVCVHSVFVSLDGYVDVTEASE